MVIPVRVCSLTHERLFAALSPEYRNVINFVLEFDGSVDAGRLSRALRTAIATEPMWGYRFVEHWWQPCWQRLTGDELCNLVTMQAADDVPEALRALYRTNPASACRATILRGPDGDTVDFQIDHRLADGPAAIQLIEQIRQHYDDDVPEPTQDCVASFNRPTMSLLRHRVTVRQRLQFLKANARTAVKLKQSAYRIPARPADAPGLTPQRVRFSAETSEVLAQLALRERATIPMLVQAVACLAVRDVLSLPADCEVPLATAVDLRRYLPPDAQAAPAASIVGMATIWVGGRDVATTRDVLHQIRQQFTAQRGPTFGLQNSPLAWDLPILRNLLQWWPYVAMRRRIRKRAIEHDVRRPLTVSDIGSLGDETAPWGDRRVTDCYVNAGEFGVSGSVLWIGIARFRSELSLTICTGGSAAFLQQFVDRLDFHIAEFLGRKCETTVHQSVESAA